MSKTPEEMAEEWANGESDLWFADISTYTDGHKSAVKQAFLAGYKAAQDQYREAVKVLDKHKAAVEKAVTNIKNASDWVTVERGEDE